MLPGAERLRRACEELHGSGPLRQRLIAAGVLFLGATSHSDEWPTETAAWAASLMDRLNMAGTVAETVAGMDEEEMEAAAARLRDFCETFA